MCDKATEFASQQCDHWHCCLSARRFLLIGLVVSECSLNSLTIHTRVPSLWFPPRSIDVQVRLIGYSEFPVGVNVSVNG